MQEVGDLATWLQGQLDQRRWSPSDLVRASDKEKGVKPLVLSSVTRWLRGETVPSVDACRILATVLNVPILEVLVAANIITRDEAQFDDAPRFDIRRVSGREIAVEIGRRLEEHPEETRQPRLLGPVRRAAYPGDMDS